MLTFESATDLIDFCNRMEIDRGVNPQVIYAIQTGEPIGLIALDELVGAIQLIQAEDEEELMDDLEIRTLAAMRPSYLFNITDSKTMNKLRVMYPRKLLSYLVNRLYEPRDPCGNLKLTFEDRIRFYRARVQQWRLVEFIDISDEHLNQILLVLLRIDGLFNLHSLTPPKFMFADCHSNPAGADNFIKQLWTWHDSLYTKKMADERQAKASNEFWGNRGSTLTRDAAINATLEAKPRSEATQTRLQKQAKSNELMVMLKGIMDAASNDTAQSASQPPIPKLKLIRAGSINFAGVNQNASV
jgi:hypothetical protein